MLLCAIIYRCDKHEKGGRRHAECVCQWKEHELKKKMISKKSLYTSARWLKETFKTFYWDRVKQPVNVSDTFRVLE